MEGIEKKKIKLGKAHIAITALAIVIIIAVVYFTLFSSTAYAKVVNGDNVSVYYTGYFANGTVFSTNVGSQPLNFTVGANEVIPGFNNAVIGMQIGQNKTVTVPPSDGYGYVNQSLIISVPLSEFGNSTVTNGEIVTSAAGQATVIAVNSTNVTVDFNPPLAGDTLVFKIQIISISK